LSSFFEKILAKSLEIFSKNCMNFTMNEKIK
jgi:hypothetical protein